MRRTRLGEARFGTVVVAVLLAGGTLALGACGGQDGGGDGRLPSGSGPVADQAGGGDDAELAVPDDIVPVDADPADVTVLDNTFDAEAIGVAAGATVRWTNHGRQDHDIVPADGDGWGVGPAEFGPGDVYEHTFDEPGTYHYYCSIHGTATRGMVGAVVVE